VQSETADAGWGRAVADVAGVITRAARVLPAAVAVRSRVAWLVARRGQVLTWRRSCLYAGLLLGLYITAWLTVFTGGSPPLNGAGEPLGGDYIAFHTAGRIILDGAPAELYDRARVVATQDGLLGGRIPGFYDAFRNPPFFGLPFVPLAALPLLWSAGVWSALSLGALALALALLLDAAPALRRRWRGLAVLVLAFPPLYFGLVDGENATLSLLLYVLVYRAVVRNQPLQAGGWAALGLFKPQLFFVFPLIFAATSRWRVLAAYSLTAGALALVSFALVGPQGAQAWLRILFEAESSNAAATAWRMASLRSFFDQLLPGQMALSLAAYSLSAASLLMVLLRRWRRSRGCTPELWALSCLVAVLVDPHLVDYDLSVLLAAGIVGWLLIERRLRWLVVLAYGVLLLRAQLPLGAASVQLTPLVLAAIALLVWRQSSVRLEQRYYVS
jgi:hypothetical protein